MESMMELIVDKRRRAPLHSVRNRFRPLLAAVLLGLPLWVGLTAEATAQTVNADGTYTVPQDWALKPSAIGAGESFRLLFISSTTRRPRVTSATGAESRRSRPHSHPALQLDLPRPLLNHRGARPRPWTTGTAHRLGGAKVPIITR